MKYATLSIAITSLLLFGCGEAATNQSSNGSSEADTTQLTDEVKDENAMTDDGQTDPNYIEIEGLAANRKGGAVVVTDSMHYWIDGQEYWEAEADKMVSVSGWLEIRDDNPVFLDTGDVIVQGIPASTEAELEANKSRHWITNATVTIKE